MSDNERWNDERFLRRACESMMSGIDWDSIDSGRLHHAASRARTCPDNKDIVVVVVSRPTAIESALIDAAEEREHAGLPESTPIWLYVPSDLEIPRALESRAVIRRVGHIKSDRSSP